jgi:DNA-binding MarR family transcriptional regulator
MDFKVDSCVFFQLAKASQAGARYWTSCVSDLKLTGVQAMVLNFLGQEDVVTSGELGKRTHLDSATLTGILDRLEAAGLLDRTRHPKDRRAIQICLTDQGREIAADLYGKAIDANKAFLSNLSAEEKVTLHSLLRKVRENAISR